MSGVTVPCAAEGCGLRMRPALTERQGLCAKHFYKWKRQQPGYRPTPFPVYPEYQPPPEQPQVAEVVFTRKPRTKIEANEDPPLDDDCLEAILNVVTSVAVELGPTGQQMPFPAMVSVFQEMNRRAVAVVGHEVIQMDPLAVPRQTALARSRARCCQAFQRLHSASTG